MLRQFPTQMFNQTCHCLEIKSPVCKMPNMLNAAPQSVPIHRTQHSEQLCKVVEAATAEASLSSPLPPRQVFHSPSDLVPAKWRSASIALLNFHPSSWMISPWSLSSNWGWCVFFFSYIICLLCRLVWKESSQSVIERWVKWSTAERFLGSFAWWGEVGHRCPFLHRQADALRTRDAFLSISPSNQCNLCLVICCTVVSAGGKTLWKKKHNRKGPGSGRKVAARIRKHTKLWKYLF